MQCFYTNFIYEFIAAFNLEYFSKMLQSNFTQNELLYDENYIYLNLEVLIDLILVRIYFLYILIKIRFKIF